MKVITLIIPAVCCVLCSTAVGETGSFRVTQFPEAVYVGEQSTFVVEADPAAVVEVYLDDRKIATDSPGRTVREVNLCLSDPGMLRFRDGSKSVSFHVVGPSGPAGLREKGGYLHSAAGCAILLVEHRDPPKHSRKWEVVKVLTSLVMDPRPRVKSGLLLAGEPAGAVDVRAVCGCADFPAGFWRNIGLSNTVNRINGLVEKVDGLEQSDVVVLAMSADDLERGSDELMLRMKLEWCLQSLAERRFEHVFVVAPVLMPRQMERFPEVCEAVRVAAGGNGAHAITILSSNRKRRLTTEEWASLIREEMARVVKW